MSTGVKITLWSFVGVLIFTLLLSITIVPAGHVGVKVVFGKVYDGFYQNGFHIVNPLARVHKMSIRTQTYTMSAKIGEGAVKGVDTVEALSKDLLLMKEDITIAYRLLPDKAAWVYRNMGKNYEEIIIRPASKTSVREANAKYNAQQACSTSREDLAKTMKSQLVARVTDLLSQYEDNPGDCFVLQQVMLRNVELPLKVKNAIEEKLEAEQQYQKMVYVIKREEEEKKRKKIEAEGIDTFQAIVNKSITPELLKWKGIQATMDLAESNNSKIIVIGGKDGMPLILNSQ